MRKITVFAVAAVFVLGMSASSWAVAEFDIGASIRANIQWNQIDDDRAQSFATAPSRLGDDGYGDLSINMANGGLSRLYVNGELDDFSARIEIRMGDGRSIRADRASATWNFGEGMYFLFGFDSDLVDLHWSDSVMDNNANYGFGAIGDNKEVQLQIGGASETWSWAFNIAQPYKVQDNILAAFVLPWNDEEANVPRFEGIGKFALGEMFDIGFSGWFQYTSLINGGAGVSDEDITEWGINSRFRYFSEFVNVGLGAFWGQNLWISGVSGGPGQLDPAGGAGFAGLAAAVADFKDTDTYGVFLTLSFPIEPVTLGVGGGFETTNTDATINRLTGAPLPNDDWTNWNFYVNVLYNFTDNFFIIPEFWYGDFGDSFTDDDSGSLWILGARLQADF